MTPHGFAGNSLLKTDAAGLLRVMATFRALAGNGRRAATGKGHLFKGLSDQAGPKARHLSQVSKARLSGA